MSADSISSTESQQNIEDEAASLWILLQQSSKEKSDAGKEKLNEDIEKCLENLVKNERLREAFAARVKQYMIDEGAYTISEIKDKRKRMKLKNDVIWLCQRLGARREKIQEAAEGIDIGTASEWKGVENPKKFLTEAVKILWKSISNPEKNPDEEHLGEIADQLYGHLASIPKIGGYLQDAYTASKNNGDDAWKCPIQTEDGDSWARLFFRIALLRIDGFGKEKNEGMIDNWDKYHDEIFEQAQELNSGATRMAEAVRQMNSGILVKQKGDTIFQEWI